MNDSSATSERSFYLYILVLGNLIAVVGMTFLMLGILGALGLISAITNSLGGLGSSFASATNESAILYSFAFLASLLSLAASWKMFQEGPRLWLLLLVIVFQLAAAAAFHSGVSVLVAIPLLAAIYGLVILLRSAPATAPWSRAARPPVEVTPAAAVAVDSPETIRYAPANATGEPAPAQATVSNAVVKEAAQRWCADCGAINPADARFCGSCGSILPG